MYTAWAGCILKLRMLLVMKEIFQEYLVVMLHMLLLIQEAEKVAN